MSKAVFIMGFICLMGCQKNLQLTSYRWSANKKQNKPELQSNLKK